MSGMGQGTVVIEASSTSGAKMQARLALTHGKKVFLLSSLVTNQKWARNYLNYGAVEVQNVDDIIAQLDTVERVREKTHKAQQLSLAL
jgi:DNA processing protein